MDGDEGNDTLYRGAGNDDMHGGFGIDRLFGEAGNDLMDGDASNDFLDGGIGNDNLFGGSGNDRLLGGAGNDLLSGDEGNDLMTGGAGNDTFDFDRRDGDDVITGQLPFGEPSASMPFPLMVRSLRPLRSLRKTAPAALDRLLDACLFADAANRPSMPELLMRLNSFITNGPAMWSAGFSPAAPVAG